jgi:hypothetical protein
VLIISFLQRCNKKKQTKKDLGSALVFLNNAKITRERRTGKNVGKLKTYLLFLESDTALSFFFFFFVFLPLRFQFPTGRHFFARTGEPSNFSFF